MKKCPKCGSEKVYETYLHECPVRGIQTPPRNRSQPQKDMHAGHAPYFLDESTL